MAEFAPSVLFQIGSFPFTNTIVNTLLVDGIVIGGAVYLKNHIKKVPGTFQNIIELVIESFYLENTNLFRTASSKARLGTAVESLQIVQKSPIIGVGFDAYRYAQIAYGLRKATTPFPSHADAGVDNSYLFVFATTGAVGLVIYLYLWYFFMRKTYFVCKQRNDGLSLLVFCSMSAVLLSGLFINSLFYAPIMLWVWVILAIIHPYEL